MAEKESGVGRQVLVHIRITVDTMSSPEVPDLQARIYEVLRPYEGVSVELTMREPRPERQPPR